MNEKNAVVANILNWASTLAILAGLYMAFLFAPTEATMGDVQRIFYFHVPSAWVAYFAFFVTFVASIVYLWRVGRHWDILALSSAEIGLAFTTMNIVSGSIWARPTWGIWWTWDPRLTTSTILWLLYVAYLMLRVAVDDETRRARFAAVFGIVAFISVPVDFMAIRWWRTIHPLMFKTTGFQLTRPMLATLLFCLGAFTILYFTLLIHRVRLERMADEVEQLKISMTRRF